MRTQILIGQVYGRWLAEDIAEMRGNEQYYACRCSCGALSSVRKSVLVAAKSGCRRCAPHAHAKTHGMTHSFEFSAWTAMRKRCEYAKHPHYALYGGRGISIAPEWRLFTAFYQNMGPCPFGRDGSLDRINADGNYEPANCRWIPKSEQSKNRRNVPLIDGKTIPELASALGIKYSTLSRRIKAGWRRELWGRTPQQLGTRS